MTTAARIFANVLQRRDAEVRASRNEGLLTAITSNISDAIYRAESDGDVVYLNDTFAKMFGYSSTEELLARQGTDLYADPEVPKQLGRELLEKGEIRP